MGKLTTIGVFLLALIPGCKRQDTECLSRIGRKVVDRAHHATASFQEKLSGFKGTLGVTDRVTQRLRNDKVLSELTIEVVMTGAEVELKGTVKTPEQKRRAYDLAETTVGVDKVNDSLQVQGD